MMEKHFTASVYIVSKINGVKKVLLHKHKKLNIWLPVGGHIEKGETPIDAVKREAKEEANLDLFLINKSKLIKTNFVTEITLPISILEENIPMHRNVKAHKHIDLIYVAKAKNPKKIKMEEIYGWFDLNQIKKLRLGKEVGYLARKALSFVP